MFSKNENTQWRRFSFWKCWWVFYCSFWLISPVEAGQPVAYILSLNTTVVELYFFESGYDYEGAPFGKRGYKNEFFKSSTRYVNWELKIEFPKPNKRIDFEIAAKLYRPDGSELQQIKTAYIESNWDNSYHARGWGNREPGKYWSVGTYRVDLYIAGDMVASRTFKVVSDNAKTTSPTKKPAPNTDLPDDLGEL